MSAAADMERGGLVETGDEYLVSHGSSGGVGRFAAEPGLWKTNMSSLEQRTMHEVMGEKLHQLGYEVEVVDTAAGSD